MLGFELLEANDVWLGFAEPSHQVVQPLVDVVDVESYDLQYIQILSCKIPNCCEECYGNTVGAGDLGA